jgi:hypothetical protein
MTYYEELGVRQDAPVEDIRQAYRLLARMLHPDNQAEPVLKPMAQRQMQRLVEVVTILSDPDQRSRYDEMLALGYRLPVPCRRQAISASMPRGWRERNRAAEIALRHWFWVLNAVFIMIFSTWAFMQSNPAAADHSGLKGATSEGTSLAVQTTRKTNRAANKRTSAIAGSAAVIPTEESSIGLGSSGLTSPKPLLSPPEMQDVPATLSIAAAPELAADVAKPQDAAPLHKASSFTGRWLYSPQPRDVSERGMYSAIYVELLLAERAGELTGDYRARYNVPDRAVSPEVTFTIRGGEGSATSGKVNWRSGDAKGQAEMTLRAPDVLDINWWTTEFGRHAALGSGTANLIRLQVP